MSSLRRVLFRNFHLGRSNGAFAGGNKRLLSSSSSTGLVSVDIKDKVAVLEMNKAPVNSLNLELCQSILENLGTIEKDHPKVQALVVTSSLSGIFSGGLDITEMHRPDPERLELFWTSVQDVFLKLYGSRLATIAAVNGHCPAGGLKLAMSCDYRIMANNEKFKTGLNETKLGLRAPYWLAELFRRTVGFREAELGLAVGKMYSPQEALSVNLVDEIIDSDKVMERSIEVANEWAKIPGFARYGSKLTLRKPYIDDLKEKKQKDLDDFVNFVTNDMVQKALDGYMQQLSKSSK